jgi:soluble lytic murein transglycosylase
MKRLLMSSVRRHRFRLLLAFLSVGVAAIYLLWNSRLEQSQDNPIQAAASHYGVDPALVKAVVWRESRFNPSVRGRAQELGLMQIREEAAQEWADAEHVSGFEHAHCLDPQTNTLAGTWYLKKLLRRYAHTDNPVPYALADYNAGRGNVLKWNTGEAASNSAIFVEQIGFPGTKAYVKSVMRRCEKYRPILDVGK